MDPCFEKDRAHLIGNRAHAAATLVGDYLIAPPTEQHFKSSAFASGVNPGEVEPLPDSLELAWDPNY